MIPDEAIEAAHRAWREQTALGGSIFEYNLRAAIEAAAPHLYAACGRADYGQSSDDQLTAEERSK